MSYYIKGNKERGAEVIALLESKGGINREDLIGIGGHIFYYIGKNNTILSCLKGGETAYLVTHYLTELTLPIKKIWEPKFKLGDYYRSKNTSNIGEITGIDSNGFYIVHLLGYSPGGMENEENIEPWKPRRGERVLIKDSEDSAWKEGIFSFQESFLYFIEGGLSWHYCVPFDENKLGKVTD